MRIQEPPPRTSIELMLELVLVINAANTLQGKPTTDTTWLEHEVRKIYIDRILADLEENTNNPNQHGNRKY